jgi:hypothetical protein
MCEHWPDQYILMDMKLVSWETILDNGNYTTTPAFARAKRDVEAGVKAVVWPEGSDEFLIYPESGKKPGEGNGVKPIKKGFVSTLSDLGWVEEFSSARRTGKGSVPGAFDCHLTFADNSSKPFVVEWETGNISSTHRAINRIALGILEERIVGGVVALPSRKLAPYLTDRIGNFPEVQPYLPLWGEWHSLSPEGYLGIVVIEQDGDSFDVPKIPKGTDGRAAR